MNFASDKQPAQSRNSNIITVILLLMIPVAIYYYFLKWRTGTLYGDDLYVYKQYLTLNGFAEKVDMPVSFGKYRPVHGLSLQLVIEWFQKNLNGYYAFNIGIQVINSILFAAIANLFLRSINLSLFFGLIIGLTRFSFFNITQLTNGGALEGLAISFFLLSLFFIVKALKKTAITSRQKQNALLLGLLFANLSMYTHERYIVILPFIIMVLFLAPSLRNLPANPKILISFVAIASVILNVVIKKYVYGMPFFVGTGGTNIEVSSFSVISFFIEGLLSIFQVNKGPEYLVGISFGTLSLANQLIVLAVLSGILFILVQYIRQVRAAFADKNKEQINDFWTFLLLVALFGLFLVPAVVTIRLEQRWLQASLCIFILMTVIALSSLRFRNKLIRNLLSGIFVILFLWSDFNYLNKGAANIYISSSENMAANFKRAIDKGTIRPGTSQLYIVQEKPDENTANAIQWTLGHGYIFEFYGGNSKQIQFTDKHYQASDSLFTKPDGGKMQVINIDNQVIDITDTYLNDSAKIFSTNKASSNTGPLLIGLDNFNQFITNGFYENENGIRWTNGNASIEIAGGYSVGEELTLELNTYLPPVCAAIKPVIRITDRENNLYPAKLLKKEGNKFFYKAQFDKAIAIQKIDISSNTINALPDVRVLSFPFISLELRKQ